MVPRASWPATAAGDVRYNKAATRVGNSRRIGICLLRSCGNESYLPARVTASKIGRSTWGRIQRPFKEGPMFRKFFCALAFVAPIALAGAPAAAQNLGNSIKVDRLEFAVTLPDGSPQTIVGYLYYHGSFQGRPLQVLVHGATYN